jgi:molecular chaperone HscB
MAWREALEDASTLAEVQALSAQVAARRNDILSTLGEALDGAQDAARAVAQVRALMFIERFQEDIERQADTLADAGST